MNVAIVGGGIMGITLAYHLAVAGTQVEIFEASPTLGGLAGPLTLPDGTDVDRFYHAILSSDHELQTLCADLGISHLMRFKETRTGFYSGGEIFSMNNVREFLTFPLLSWIDRIRLGLTVMNAQRVKDWRSLEGISVRKWLVRWGGQNAYQNIWQPMLKAKFDGDFDQVPATWIWSRLVRVKSARNGASQKELAGHLVGGYITLIKAMAEKIEAAGGQIRLSTPVQEVIIEGNDSHQRATGLRIANETKRYDAVVVTSQVPVFRRLIPAAQPEYQAYLGKTDYLGIVCPLLVLDRPLTGYWTLNITDESIPFTGVIETTSYIDPTFVGGHHLVYLPKYTMPGSPLQKASDEEIKALWLQYIQQMFPNFDPAWIRYFLIHRERYVEPIHPLNSAHLIPEIQTPIQSLYLATTAQIYPALTNGESVCQHASAAAKQILQQPNDGALLSWPTPEPVRERV